MSIAWLDPASYPRYGILRTALNTSHNIRRTELQITIRAYRRNKIALILQASTIQLIQSHLSITKYNQVEGNHLSSGGRNRSSGVNAAAEKSLSEDRNGAALGLLAGLGAGVDELVGGGGSNSGCDES
jgi:hypothetical protein